MIEIERDGECVTMLNRLVSKANTTGLRVDIEVVQIRHTGRPWETPLVSANVYRPVKPKEVPAAESATQA